MAKKSSKGRERPAEAASAGAGPGRSAGDDVRRVDERVGAGLFVAGLVFLGISAVMSLMLVLDHIGGLSLPGCGEGSPCAEAAASVWGRVPGVNWPVSFLGLAYFAGALAAWLGSRHGIPPAFGNVARLGALISLGFVVVIFVEGHVCHYCLAAHAGNLAFWIVMERSRRSAVASWRPVVMMALVFIAASAVLGTTEWREKKIVEAKQEEALAESTEQIIAAVEKAARASRDAAESPSSAEQGREAAAAGPGGAASERAGSPEAGQRPWEGGFRGRYLYGPEEAPVRLVMITDYQCVDCNRIEEEVREMLHQREDVSLSVKYFPMCTDCNRHFKKNKHPNACWAARAAETAGILAGNDGFWRMHFWLFDQDGGFTNAELNSGLAELGFDRTEFLEVMRSAQTLELVQSDIEEAVWLGLHYTPMVFINGVELKGVFAKNAVPRAVAAVAAKNPPAMTHDNDQPPPASEKYIGDWREKRARRMPPDQYPWARGTQEATLRIVVWGDYQEPFSAEAVAIIERLIAGRTDVYYSFRHYPINTECNPATQADKHPLACRASKAAEAAGRMGGLEGYWIMHHWLMENQEQFGDASVRQAAEGMGLDGDAFMATMEDPAVAEAIAEDCRAGKQMGLRSIPMIFVNGKHVPRWHVEGVNILELIITEAGQG
jgi:protein-disulfide isomerase